MEAKVEFKHRVTGQVLEWNEGDSGLDILKRVAIHPETAVLCQDPYGHHLDDLKQRSVVADTRFPRWKWIDPEVAVYNVRKGTITRLPFDRKETEAFVGPADMLTFATPERPGLDLVFPNWEFCFTPGEEEAHNNQIQPTAKSGG